MDMSSFKLLTTYSKFTQKILFSPFRFCWPGRWLLRITMSKDMVDDVSEVDVLFFSIFFFFTVGGHNFNLIPLFFLS